MKQKTNFATMDDAALAKACAEKREAVRSFRFRGLGATPRDAEAARGERKDIARILTEQGKRRRAALA